MQPVATPAVDHPCGLQAEFWQHSLALHSAAAHCTSFLFELNSPLVESAFAQLVSLLSKPLFALVAPHVGFAEQHLACVHFSAPSHFVSLFAGM